MEKFALGDLVARNGWDFGRDRIGIWLGVPKMQGGKPSGWAVMLLNEEDEDLYIWGASPSMWRLATEADLKEYRKWYESR